MSLWLLFDKQINSTKYKTFHFYKKQFFKLSRISKYIVRRKFYVIYYMRGKGDESADFHYTSLLQYQYYQTIVYYIIFSLLLHETDFFWRN